MSWHKLLEYFLVTIKDQFLFIVNTMASNIVTLEAIASAAMVKQGMWFLWITEFEVYGISYRCPVNVLFNRRICTGHKGGIADMHFS